MEGSKRWAGLILRIVVTVGAAFWIARAVDWQALAHTLAHTDWTWVAAAVACFGAVMLLVARRWQRLLAVQRLALPYKEALAVSFIGQFFNAFLLGTAGGDVAKIYYAARWSPGRRTPVILSVLVDRGLGLAAVAALAVGFGVARYDVLTQSHATAAVLALVGAMTAAGVGILLGAWLLPRVRAFAQKRGWWERLPLHKLLEKVHDAWERYARVPGELIAAFTFSIIIQLLMIGLHACVLRGMGLGVPWMELVAIVSIVQLVAALPVSLSGLGPREGLTILFLALFGISSAQALAFSLVSFAVTLAWSAVGGIVYVRYRKQQGAAAENIRPASDAEDLQAMEAAARGIVERLQKAGFAAYFAGGCVRDRLMGKAAHDFDIATSARPEEVQRVFRRVTGLEGKVFGVVRVLEGGWMFEVATFRTDGSYQDGRRPTSVMFATAEEDAARRDFTVNGVFYDPVRGEVLDYVGGRADLAAKTLRAIGDPAARFAEDRLRLLRAIRFAVNLDFEIDPRTWDALRAHAADLKGVSPERVREELDKIWTGPNPARGLDLLDASGLLRAVLPELDALHGVEQPPQFHPEGDVYKHVRLMLSHLQEAPLSLALAVLFHDVGKPATSRVDETGRIRFNGHETVGARMTEQILRRLRYSNDVIEETVAMVANHMTFKDAPQMKLSTLKKLIARPTYPLELELHRIDCSGSHGDLSIHKYLVEQEAAMPPEAVRPPRLISGDDLMQLGIPFGPAVGKILGAVVDEQLEGRVTTRKQALAFAEKMWRAQSDATAKS